MTLENMHGVRVLVTGADGFIGSHLVDSLLSDGHTVTVFDNFDPFYSRAIKEQNVTAHRTNAAWTLIEGDLRNRQALEALPLEERDLVRVFGRAYEEYRRRVLEPGRNGRGTALHGMYRFLPGLCSKGAPGRQRVRHGLRAR